MLPRDEYTSQTLSAVRDSSRFDNRRRRWRRRGQRAWARGHASQSAAPQAEAVTHRSDGDMGTLRHSRCGPRTSGRRNLTSLVHSHRSRHSTRGEAGVDVGRALTEEQYQTCSTGKTTWTDGKPWVLAGDRESAVTQIDLSADRRRKCSSWDARSGRRIHRDLA